MTEIFAAAAAKSSEAVAVEADGRAYSYTRLAGWSDAVCSTLRSRGVGRGDRVALRMHPGAGAIAAMLGILKSGAAYVPLDVRNPPSRNEFIITDSRVAAFVGDPEGCNPHAVPVVDQDDVSGMHDRKPEPSDTGSKLLPQDTAYIIYTSGTTGRPKGVPVRHGSVAALLSATSGLFSLSSRDRWLLFHSIAFDFSVWEVWGALSTGARLVVLPHWTARSPESSLRVIAEREITVLSQTPTAFGALAAAAIREGIDLPKLRYIVFGGEKLTPTVVRPWSRRFGLRQPRLVNMYGITETTVHATGHELTEDDLEGEDSCIGRLLPGFTARVVAEDGQDVADGERGELWLAGPQVADGYIDRPELTAERFPTAPASDGSFGLRYYRSGDVVSRRSGGDLVYHGRADLQVKLRGHRIELSDVETAVRSHDSVVDAVTWVREFKSGDERLVCAYTTAGEATSPDARALRRHVKALLPSYMQPSSYQLLPVLPRTVNGKVDRAAVVRIWEERRQQPMPDARTASQAAEIRRLTLEWVAEILEEPQAMLEDNFLDLGGHSMLALQLGERAKQRFGADYDLKILFEGDLASAADDLASRAAQS